MQFEGKLKFLFGQKKKGCTGTAPPPQMALFCIAVPLLVSPVTEVKMKNLLVRTQKKPGVPFNTENIAKPFQSMNDEEQNGRNGHQGLCFPNMLHNTENHIKSMNACENGISLRKVRTNEEQWIWVEANAPLLYRNGCSDYVIVPKQGQRNDNPLVKKQNNILGMKGSREFLLCNSSSEPPALLKQHLTWAKNEKEDMKITFHPSKSDTFLQEESILSKHFSNIQNHCNTSSGWTVKNSAESRSGHHFLGSFSSRTGRSFYSMDQSLSGVNMADHPHHGSTEHFQTYQGLPQHSVDTYPIDNIKMESTFGTQDIVHDSGLPLNIPIKIENDSDSESMCELYPEHNPHGWLSDSNALKRNLLDFSEGLFLKTESDLSEQNVCLKPKHHMHSPHRGHCFVPAAQINHRNTSRPFKEVYSKQSAQFYPQKCAHIESMLSHQGADCLNSPLYAATSIDDKSQGNQSYKLQCDLKAHSIVHNIKREPLDSPPWVEDGQDSIPLLCQKNTLMGFLPDQMQRNAAEFAYIQ